MAFEDSTHLFGANGVFIEELYEKYQQNPASVDDSWRDFFAEFSENIDQITQNNIGATWAPRRNRIVGYKDREPSNQNTKAVTDVADYARASMNALGLIRAFRVRGHLSADLDPLGLTGHSPHPDLDPRTYGFEDEDFDKEIYLGGALGFETATLNELLAKLKNIYSSKIGYEYMHIESLEQREWIANKIENRDGFNLSPAQKEKILKDIVEVESFEQFIHTKFPGAKRFSVEGGESSIAATEAIIDDAARNGIEDVVIGMPHRGRLNVLTKVMGKPYEALLSEFKGGLSIPEGLGASGDVKYHMGASSDRNIEGNDIHLSLTANPSHLEAVNPVVSGKVRAKQVQKNDNYRKKAFGLLFHGDAAFAGQGVVAETLSFSDLIGYRTGGIYHIVINNQIGFTTAPRNARKAPYPTEVAKIVQAPIFHVNGDDPEAVYFAALLAAEFRREFQRDVVLDVICYRRYGHNEGDEPMFTQPIMYNVINSLKTPMDVYSNKLISEGTITKDKYEEIKSNFKSLLDKAFIDADSFKANADWLEGKWEGFIKPKSGTKPVAKTAISEKVMQEIGKAITTYPKDLSINKKVERLLSNRQKMFESGKSFDWATAEALAFGSLLNEGNNVRLSGQDCTRGTFSHRHSAIIDQKTEERYYNLNYIKEDQGHLEVVDSNLSEFAVLGFEYGYSLADPNTLNLWEAQFGDFVNGAQVIIDQFISSGEAKWLRLSGLVMLLPHGYEGQGPEHSSARPERFLQLCGEDNMQVVNCTTPANYFHVLRRQIVRDFRKPLIITTPKSLLRHKSAISDQEDFTKGNFERVIGDKKVTKAKRVVICSGKVYYDLLERRDEEKLDVAIIRLEQYYPFPKEDLADELKKYKDAEIIWAQEEPKNMGAWFFVNERIESVMNEIGNNARPIYAGRSASASPATGYMKVHNAQQNLLIEQALGIN